ELWIVARGPTALPFDANNTSVRPVPPDDEWMIPGSGALVAKVPNAPKPLPVPLKHTDVKANISGYIATVDVTQQYHNPFDSKIEAVYVFPLPHNAAINEFVMTIGDRKIRGIIRERAEAERVYHAARSQGYVASLLTQERPNIFTQAVANIEPGKRIDIAIRYFHTLAYSDGYYEWHFPMVVGPRFNPPSTSGQGVGAVARNDRGASGQKTEVQYLKPTERSGHDIALSVNIDAGVPASDLLSVNHAIRAQADDAAPVDARANQPIARQQRRWAVTLSHADAVPNKDFVLRYRVAADKPQAGLVATRDDNGAGYFTLMLYPPKSLQNLPRKPLELVFVVDCSGSMSGRPLEQAKAAIRTSLQRMRPDDTFQVIKFASDAQLMTPRAIPASRDNVARALAYLEENYGGGGTMMLEGIRAALDAPADPSRLRFVCFLTDGFIGNEAEILREIRAKLGASRIFSFGVGSSVNRYLLEHMAKIGRGAVAYLAHDEKAEPVMTAFFDRIAHPALTDLSIDFGGMKVSDVFPAQIPDLFVGRPVIVTGKFAGAGKPTVRVTGKTANEPETITLTPDLDSATAKNTALRPIWARMKIADLADRSAWETVTDLPAQIKTLALEHGLMSAYTAFVAVDATRRTDGASGTTVAVPVPTPEGVKYETTVK
ncbi:MAG TPA: VIT domain-containing protein, partial [Tepidisphaeraceae bacterium]|nr:VIT domain-containing protein [Tepidisphaeraceae bacterium]